MLTKLLIYRKNKIKSDTISGSDLASFVTGDVLNISPRTWDDAHGLSHYGFVLEGINLKKLEVLTQFEKDHPNCTILDMYVMEDKKPKARSILETLATVGLRINELAE